MQHGSQSGHSPTIRIFASAVALLDSSSEISHNVRFQNPNESVDSPCPSARGRNDRVLCSSVSACDVRASTPGGGDDDDAALENKMVLFRARFVVSV